MTATVGTGASIVPPGGSTSTYEVTNISWTGHSRAALDSSHLKTTVGREFIPSDLYDAGEIEITVLARLDNFEDLSAASVTAITVTDGAGQSFEAGGFSIGYDATIPLEELQEGTIRFKLSGAVT